MRLIDLCSGRWGWSRAFAARGWKIIGVDLVEPPEIPRGFTFYKADILDMEVHGQIWAHGIDFAVASTPCEQFSVHGMKHFHPNPPYPEKGIRLFNHARMLFEEAGIPYVMENVRAAQQFVGQAVHHCGPFYLWGNAVPPLLHKGIIKGWETKYRKINGRWVGGGPGRAPWSTAPERAAATAKVSTIPHELANCVADYAERIIENPPKINLTKSVLT